MNTEIQIVYCLMPIPTLLYEPITDLPLHQPTQDQEVYLIFHSYNTHSSVLC